MIKPDVPVNDAERVAALKEYSILDTFPEQEYDEITFLASQICGTPISLISLVDDKRQWFKSHHGTDGTETPRDVAFCAHAINDKDNPFVIPDSRKDIRFQGNPLVTGNPEIIFYAGIPLVNPEGFAIGTLCVTDNKPREISDEQIKALKALSHQLMQLFELRKKSYQLERIVKTLETQNRGLQDFVRIAAHDIKSPMANIIMISELLLEGHSVYMNEDCQSLLGTINDSASQLNQLVDGILRYSRDANVLNQSREDIDVHLMLKAIAKLLDNKQHVEIIPAFSADLRVFTNKTALKQILVNLITNAIKYNDKDIAQITVTITRNGRDVHFIVADNGPGIKDSDKEKIFNLFATTSNKDRNGQRGTGIGLATVKSLVESLGGEITIESEVPNGASFIFSIKE